MSVWFPTETARWASLRPTYQGTLLGAAYKDREGKDESEQKLIVHRAPQPITVTSQIEQQP